MTTQHPGLDVAALRAAYAAAAPGEWAVELDGEIVAPEAGLRRYVAHAFRSETHGQANAAFIAAARNALPGLLDRLEAAEEALARVRALDLDCELYDTPGQDCITAGPGVFAADGCTPCHIRDAIEGPTP